MDATTTMTVNQIRERGYYQTSQTLGDGGWGEVYKFADNWGHYVLEINGEIACEIKAKNDGVALHTFETLFHLDECEAYEIYQKIITFRTIAGNI